MSKKAQFPQSPHHILVFDEDWEYLQRTYGAESGNRLGVSPIIRQIIHAYVQRLRARTESAMSEIPQEAPANAE